MKPLRGKRVGSAQSARRIQPGDGSGLAGSPADLSRSPFLPTSPPPLPPTLTALPFVSGQKWAALRAHFHQGYAPRPAPGRLGRMAGKGAQGSPPLRWRAHHPRVLQPPGSSACQIPGLREPDLWPRSPCSRRSPPRVTSVFFGGRAAPPSTRPLSHPGPPPTWWVGPGRTVPSAPWAGRTVGPGGCFSVTQVSKASAPGQRRCWPPNRPV